MLVKTCQLLCHFWLLINQTVNRFSPIFHPGMHRWWHCRQWHWLQVSTCQGTAANARTTPIAHSSSMLRGDDIPCFFRLKPIFNHCCFKSKSSWYPLRPKMLGYLYQLVIRFVIVRWSYVLLCSFWSNGSFVSHFSLVPRFLSWFYLGTYTFLKIRCLNKDKFHKLDRRLRLQALMVAP